MRALKSHENNIDNIFLWNIAIFIIATRTHTPNTYMYLFIIYFLCFVYCVFFAYREINNIATSVPCRLQNEGG